MDETFGLIQNLSDERFALYLKAAKQALSPAEQSRMVEINNRLPMLWDQHRRDVATKRWSNPSYATELFRAA